MNRPMVDERIAAIVKRGYMLENPEVSGCYAECVTMRLVCRRPRATPENQQETRKGILNDHTPRPSQ